MGYSIKLSEKKEYVILVIEGDFTGKDMLKYILEAHAFGHKKKVDNYLVDVTKAKNVDSVLGNYEFAYTDIQSIPGVNPRSKVASLINPEDHSHDFIETVLINAGMPIKLCRDLETAEKYLLGK
ncbi:MAG: hypothetical protein JW956_03595 [Calditrichaceae bacterium]|nr:hypothetical protein [Calditrichaceae bacterium]HES59949.1 hypothetical protein [Caldithrix sp.]